MEIENGNVAVADSAIRLETQKLEMRHSASASTQYVNSIQGVHEPMSASRPWIISPSIDLLFFCNYPWLLALVPLVLDPSNLPHIEFWQIYFLTTPHRWLTLALVATDRERRGSRTLWFALLAIVAAFLVLGMRWASGGFACLAVVDYVWNAWHFGSQHAGILRLYSRQSGGPAMLGETLIFRIAVPYTALRLAAWLTAGIGTNHSIDAVVFVIDHVVMLLLVWLILQEMMHFRPARIGAFCYSLSVCLLYGSLLWAVSHQISELVLSLAVAASVFHAMEYLAFVSFYAQQRKTVGAASLFRTLARQWTLLLVVYVAIVGFAGFAISRHWAELWIGLNLWAALLHYAYDGMIWKLRRPTTAAVLGINS